MSTTILLADTDATVITTAISSMVDTVSSVIVSVLPVVLPVGAIIIAATVGYRLFKKFAKG